MRLVFDIETNGLLQELDTLHSLVIKDLDTGVVYSCTKHFYTSETTKVMTLTEGVDLLMKADLVIGHNIVKFDLPALLKLYPWFQLKEGAQVFDTVLVSRLNYPSLGDWDAIQAKRQKFPRRLTGSHGLKAWGYRLGILKGDFSEDADWSTWTWDMQTYCEQDVEVSSTLYLKMVKDQVPEKALWVETRFARVIAMMEGNGFGLDQTATLALYGNLVRRRMEISKQLIEAFPPLEKSEVFVPKVNNAARGYVRGLPFTKRWMVEFNPSSRQMIAERLVRLGWKPTEFTPSGQAKIDETVLQSLPWPEAKLLAEHFLVEKRIGQIAEGDQAWLKLLRQGRIHGSVNTNGAVTGRCTHSQPNVAQVPRVGTPYGSECRALWGPRKGWVLVGADLSGLELRCLAHFMALYDGGVYGKIILEGDIHTVNQEAAGLPNRNDAKTFIYAFLYGAGDQKIGSIVLPNGTPEEQTKIGKKLKKAFLAKTPALKALREAVAARVKAKNGYLRGLDGRRLFVRSEHSALNTLLQSAGALISKVAMIYAYDMLEAKGYRHGYDYGFCAHIHDEIQTECRPDIAEEVGRTVVEAMREAGRYFAFSIPIDGEWKVGNNWMETH